jgi:hypothetical protein
MNTILAFGFHGGHHAGGGLVFTLIALAIIVGAILLMKSDRSDDKKS